MKKAILLSLGLTSIMLTTTQAATLAKEPDAEALKAQVQTDVVLGIATNGLADILKSPLCKEPKTAELIEMCTRTALTLVAMDATTEAHKPAVQTKAAAASTSAQVTTATPETQVVNMLENMPEPEITLENTMLEPGNVAIGTVPTPSVTATVEPAATTAPPAPTAITAPTPAATTTVPSTPLVPVEDALPKTTTATTPAATSTPATEITITTNATP